MRRMTTMASLVCASALGCVSRPLEDGGSTGGSTSVTDGGEVSGVPTTGGAGEGSGGAPGTTSDGTGTAPEPGTTGSTTDEQEDTTCGFICDPTDEPDLLQCDPYVQDCPEGQKCAAYAEGGGSSWNASKCVPVMGDLQPGDPCTAQESGVSGLDDCAKGVMCWDVDQRGHGICVGLCVGSESMPVCPDEDNFDCAITGEGSLNICLPNCDLLLQDCQGDDLCIPIGGTGVCALDASGVEDGEVFDPCEYANACDKGLLCVLPSAAVECDPDVEGCCLPMCDLDLPDPMCPGAGQSCVPLFEPGAPPKYAHVGVCMIEV